MAFWTDTLDQSPKRRGSKHNIDRRTYQIQARDYAKRGSDLPQSKVNAAIVRKIRIDADIGVTAKSQAAEYGVHIRTIEKIRRFESWTHV